MPTTVENTTLTETDDTIRVENDNVGFVVDNGHYLIKGSTNLLIEEETIITDEKRTWEHVVTAKDKRIRLRNSGGTYDLQVIKNRTPKDEEITETFDGDTYINDVYNMGDNIPIVPSGYRFNIDNMGHYWVMNKNLKLILSEDYGCKAFPTSGLASYVHLSSRTNALRNLSVPEQIALETLRETITEKDFRKYMRDGFILVQAQSGRVYQIFRTGSHIRVWQSGSIIEEICIHFKNRNVPLTDKVFAFKIMIETDEEEFKKLGNVYKYGVARIAA